MLRLGIGTGLIAALLFTPVHGQEFNNPKANIPPQAKPERRNAGEGIPPLPLPATPLRRSEKKREPSPPALVGSVGFAKGSIQGGAEWKTTQLDIEKWVQFTNSQLGQKYRYVSTDFSRFSYDPTELPILYFTGWQALPAFDDVTIQKLRKYLTDGGTWVIHSSCGRPEFNQSVKEQIRRVFPDRELAAIPTDHPIFRSFHQINQMHVRKDSDPVKPLPPYLEVINIGTRAAVIFSPIDLSCGWDVEKDPINGGVLYTQSDALKLCANISTYVLAEYQYGRFFAHEKIYHQTDQATRDQLVLGQIIHSGDWDPVPHGIPNLLKSIDESTTLNVQFKRTPVDPEKEDIFKYPIVIMIGQREFKFSDSAVKRLREYLNNGGVLLVDDAIGTSEFDHAFRREIKRIYPDKELHPLSIGHPIFSFLNEVKEIRLAPLGNQLYPGMTEPLLEVIEVDGQLPVVYSRISMSAGWEKLPRAYNVGYSDDDALKLGTNVLMYLVTH